MTTSQLFALFAIVVVAPHMSRDRANLFAAVSVFVSLVLLVAA